MKSIKNPLTKKVHKEICRLYKNKILSTTLICKKYHISPNTLYSILDRYKIVLRGNKLSNKEQKQIAILYKQGHSVSKICEKLKLSKSSVLKYLKIKKVKMRKTAGRFQQTYQIDDALLNKINSKEKAQFLGLIYSDGSLSKSNNTISIRLREDDSDYLNQWRTKLLKTNKPLYFSRTSKNMVSPINSKIYNLKYGCAILDITNAKIYSDAIKIGLCPNKTSKNLGMPNLPKKYIPYFILGLFEGDGCISYCNKSCNLTIACQSNMAQDLYNYFNNIGIKANNYVRKSINIIQISRKKDIIRVFDIFYSNPSSVLMKRKHKKYKDIIKNY